MSIPIFTSQLEKAKLATCQANRRSLLAEVRVKALDSDIDQEEAFKDLYAADGAKFPCPKGGIFSWKDGQILCSVHDGTNSGISTITVSGNQIKITEKVVKDFSDGDIPSYQEGQICAVKGTYYIIISPWTNGRKRQVTGDYETWFKTNIASYNAKAIDVTQLYTKDYLHQGQLYKIGKVVYVAHWGQTIGNQMDMTKLTEFGTVD